MTDGRGVDMLVNTDFCFSIVAVPCFGLQLVIRVLPSCSPYMAWFKTSKSQTDNL